MLYEPMRSGSCSAGSCARPTPGSGSISATADIRFLSLCLAKQPTLYEPRACDQCEHQGGHEPQIERARVAQTGDELIAEHRSDERARQDAERASQHEIAETQV